MSEHQARHVRFRDWSGVAIRGLHRYECPSPAGEWDVAFAGVAAPEGGAYDTVFSADGTAMTWGLMQWTATSGRLQKLLRRVEIEAGAEWDRSGVPVLLRDLGIYVSQDGEFRTWDDGRVLISKSELRDLFTPPGGKVPARGKNWERARDLALAFALLGLNSKATDIQERFFLDELKSEVRYSRPRLKGRSLAYYFYARGWPDRNAPVADPILAAARAVVLSMWQNAPRAAEEHIRRALDDTPFRAGSEEDLSKISRVFARSTFGYWGNAKCALKKRRSRWHKTAEAVNDALGRRLLEPSLK